MPCATTPACGGFKLLDLSNDQAAGLRRILGARKSRYLSVLTAIEPAQKNAVLLNLAAALVRAGSEVQLLDASLSADGIAYCAAQLPTPSLWQLACRQGDAQQAVQPHGPGVRIARLSHRPLSEQLSSPDDTTRLSQQLQALSPAGHFCLVDTDLQRDNPFVLPELAQGEMVVLTSSTATSIKHAYAQIKALHGQLGRRPFLLMVVGATLVQAEKIQQNIAQAANQYLAVPVRFLGNIPSDEHLGRALQLGRPVVEAFPMASASVALREVAARLLNPGQPPSPVTMLER